MRKLNRNTSFARLQEIAKEGGVHSKPVVIDVQRSEELNPSFDHRQHQAYVNAINLISRADEICQSNGLDFEAVKEASKALRDVTLVHPDDIGGYILTGEPMYTLSR
ncbi:hypothetical protein [Pseudomonas haemolytica]|uniref:hypothetical protein n=1 Tax=Pseudomonas haemolytica TaxID=2600065 RepID=UPI00190B91CA|nr:hypothetical protein [Pseudomonas haemolytica]MBK3450822.1 hypothetical protein [Pseudomonas haemolytica]